MSSSWRHPGRTGAIVYAVAATIIGALTAGLSRLQVERQRGRRAAAQRLPPGAIIVISNHTSYADGVLLALACRRLGRSLRLLATAGLFRMPLLGRIVRKLGFIAVRRDTADASQSLEPAAEALRAGEAVGLYPEGRLTRDPAMWPERAKTGAVRLALMTSAPIVPVAMVGAHRVVSRSRVLLSIVTSLVRRPRVGVLVGEPIDVRRLMGIDEDAKPAQAEVRRAADAVMATLVALVGELRGEKAPDPMGVPRIEA